MLPVHGQSTKGHLRVATVGPFHAVPTRPRRSDGGSASLASRINRDPASVERLLDELADLGYVEFDGKGALADRRAWLTIRGYDLVKATEDELLGASRGSA